MPMGNNNRKRSADDLVDLAEDIMPEPASTPSPKAERRKPDASSLFMKTDRPKKDEKPEEKVAMTVMVPRSLNEQFRALSKINDMSMNSMIVEDMRRRVKDDEDMVNEVVALDARLAAMRKKSGRAR